MIPDSLPVLKAGAHVNPGQGACVMEYISLLTGDRWTDYPACTEPVVAKAAQYLNDLLPDEQRSAVILPRLERIMGARPLPFFVRRDGNGRPEWRAVIDRGRFFGYPEFYLLDSPSTLDAVLDHHYKLMEQYGVTAGAFVCDIPEGAIK